MSRRIALALSFSMTIVVTFAVISFASQAGWLEAKSEDDAAATVEEPVESAPPPAAAVQQDPVVITEYVYLDLPATAAPTQAATAVPATPMPQPAAIAQSSGNGSSVGTASAPRQSTQPAQAPPTTRSSRGGGDDGQDEDKQEDEHEEEHEDEHEDEDD